MATHQNLTAEQIEPPSTNNPINPQRVLPGRDDIRSKHKLYGNEPFAMHLVNGRLGGSGTDRGNLAWGSHNFNVKHCNVWEQNLQNMAQSSMYNNCEMTLEVLAKYKSDRANNPDFHYLDLLYCSHSLKDPTGGVIDATTNVLIQDNKAYEPSDPGWTPQKGDPSNWGDIW